MTWKPDRPVSSGATAYHDAIVNASWHIAGGSSTAFLDEMDKLGIILKQQLKPGISAGRRQSYEETSKLPGVDIICSTEAEKYSLVHDCLHILLQPFTHDTADIVMAKRTPESFETYPENQRKYEKKGNKLLNDILRQHDLLPANAEDLDFWFGPKLFKNTPEIVNLFLQKYNFRRLDRKLDQKVNPESWPDALFFPIVLALHEKKRIVSVDIPHTHPPEQTASEQDSEEHRKKEMNNIKIFFYLLFI